MGIRGECDRLDRCEANIEESAMGSTEYDGIIAVNQVGDTSIKKDIIFWYGWLRVLMWWLIMDPQGLKAIQHESFS